MGKPSGGGGKPTKTLPVYTYDQIAGQLTDGFWAYNGSSRRSFNVSPGGTITVNITALTAEGKFFAREALAQWTDVTGVKFSEVTTGGQITFDDNQSGAYSTSSVTGSTITSSFVNVSTQWIANYGTSIYSYSMQTYIHEIGHALGLGHAGNYNGSATYPRNAHYANDSWATSIMSYFSQIDNTYFSGQGFTGNYVVTPMVADGVAMATLYGTSTTTRIGDTTYGFNNNSGRGAYDAATSPSAAYTVYDSGGIDTLDYSGFSANQSINLNAETFSNVGGRVGNVSIARGTVIENVIGGSGSDTLTGNSAANNLKGGAGADTLIGGSGGDMLTGGTGSDIFRGTAADLNGDTVADIEAGDRIHITDGSLSTISVSGTTLNLGGGRTLTIANGSGKAFTINSASDGGINVVVSGTSGQAAGADFAALPTSADMATSTGASTSSSNGIGQRDLQIARMIQDMAGFGGASGDGLARARGFSEQRYEYFAVA